MGRAISGMEDDEPIADACKMPTFTGSFEEGRGKLSRNLPTETSFTDGKVERPVRDLSRRVIRSDSRASLDGDEGDKEEKRSEEQEEEEEDAKGNNNNNCNGGGGGERRRRASAVEILRRNFGVSKSHSLCLNTNPRMYHSTEHGPLEGAGDTSVKHGGGSEGCRKSECESGDAGTENEPTLSDLTTLDAQGGEVVSATGQCRHKGDSEDKTDEFVNDEEHIYCTVYCIANDKHRRDAEITDDDDTAPETDSETGHDMGGDISEPVFYTLDDLVDPFGDIAHHRLSTVLSAADATMKSCQVCLEVKSIVPLPCCRKPVCDECLKLYVSPQVRIAKSFIVCPIHECSGYLDEALVVSHLAAEELAKYRYFLELSQLDSSTKPCPKCSQFTSLKEQNHNRSEHKYKIQCSNCQFVWCFKCHAPWHNGLKCREYRKEDKLLRTWANVVEHGQRNAQKCPRCKIHIQRTEGCDHMTCTQCNTNFCYRCGERYRHLRFFGDHTSNLSVFGCKFRYLPDKPHLRRLIRGSVCATKVLIAPVVILLVVVLGALALVIGLVVFPVYYVCKRRKKQRTQGSGRWI
ncbi:probable E3 ubiquitin-protein ligase RNF217 [Notolabrus celidotus]|uniref:probable E3 ubiquitin-protein ligase RNF217 n=1 Tax=Notolabrus celidotus TaxID=1203425 RepID=UPI00149019E7|nr:probable E3 ubiquitin-protein ligase RNF217 [Notolabrus celidotus]